jgi:SAM-dependent methyltransferase
MTAPVPPLERVANVSQSHHRFLGGTAADEWDRVAYAPGTYDSFIWGLERHLLVRLAQKLAATRPALKYLDFACGTGRVLQALAPYAARAHGVDVSPVMVQCAAEKVSTASIRLGDLLASPDIADRDYDLITAFRFFLNAEPELRLAYLTDLCSRLKDAESRLLFNIHANTLGLDGLAARIARTNVMSPLEVRGLIRKAGLEVVAWHGLGTMPACRSGLYGLSSAMRSFDRWAAGRRFLRTVSRDLLFVCRRRSALR